MYDLSRHRRRSIRLPGHDYAQPGAYFVTICTQDHVCLFGDIVDGEMRLNEYGYVVQQCWDEIPTHFPHAELDAFVIMPNHIHGIIRIIHPVGARHAAPLQERHAAPLQERHAAPLQERHAAPLQERHAAPLQEWHAAPPREQFGKPVPGSIPTIVRSLKSAVTRRINLLRGTPGAPVWQRNYYEHIIRGEREWAAIREYILANPARWPADPENPAMGRPARPDSGGLP